MGRELGGDIIARRANGSDRFIVAVRWQPGRGWNYSGGRGRAGQILVTPIGTFQHYHYRT